MFQSVRRRFRRESVRSAELKMRTIESGAWLNGADLSGSQQLSGRHFVSAKHRLNVGKDYAVRLFVPRSYQARVRLPWHVDLIGFVHLQGVNSSRG